MSALDDIRRAIQDLVVPDQKALQETVKSLYAEMKAGFASSEKLAEVRHELLMVELRNQQAIQDARYAAIMRELDVDRRLERLEAARQPAQPVTGD